MSVLSIVLLGLVLVLALALAAFCAGTETGFSSVNRGRILHMARGGSRAAKIAQKALSNLPKTLTALLVGNNLASVTYSAASAALAARLLSESVSAQAVWSFCAAFMMLALGEFLPKLLCAARPLRRTLRLAGWYRVFSFVFAPLTYIALALTSVFSPKRSSARERVTPNDLLQILQDRKDGVKLKEFESALIARILVLRVKGEPITAEAILKAIDEE